MNCQTSTKQTKAQLNKKAAGVQKTPLKTKAYENDFFTTFSAISSQVIARKSIGLFTYRASNFLGPAWYHV